MFVWPPEVSKWHKREGKRERSKRKRIHVMNMFFKTTTDLQYTLKEVWFELGPIFQNRGTVLSRYCTCNKINIIAFGVELECTPNTDWSQDCMEQHWLNEWNLECTSSIPHRFCRGGWHHHQLGEGERAWDQDHQTHSLIFVHHYTL